RRKKLLVLVFFVSGKSESYIGVADRVIAETPATQAVAIRGDTAVRHISTEGVDNELASVHKVGHGTRGGPAGVRNFTWRMETEQHLAGPCVSSVECSIPLAKENQVAGDKHTRFRRL